MQKILWVVVLGVSCTLNGMDRNRVEQLKREFDAKWAEACQLQANDPELQIKVRGGKCTQGSYRKITVQKDGQEPRVLFYGVIPKPQQ
jgi:hypothetical protein